MDTELRSAEASLVRISENKDFAYCFNNFYPAAIYLDGKIWPTVVHYYHAQKFSSASLAEQIRRIQEPKDVLEFVKQNKKLKRADWEDLKLPTMRRALLAKFTQHPDLEEALMKTGDAKFVDTTTTSNFWGLGKDGRGSNHLGNLLASIRHELQNADRAPETPLLPGERPQRITLEGNRIRLVPLDIDKDVEELYQVTHGESAEVMWTWVYNGGPFNSPEEMRRFLMRYHTPADWVPWVVVDIASGQKIGSYCLINVDAANRRLEVGGVWIAPKFQGTYAFTEANLLALEYCFETLKYRRIEWKAHHKNVASQRAALRLGFTFEGRFRQHFIHKGTNRDSMYYSLLDYEWPEVKERLKKRLGQFTSAGAAH